MRTNILSILLKFVGDFQDGDADKKRNFKGFFLQEEDADTDSDPQTSEGIYVYDPTTIVDVNVGDLVRALFVLFRVYLYALKGFSHVDISFSAKRIKLFLRSQLLARWMSIMGRHKSRKFRLSKFCHLTPPSRQLPLLPYQKAEQP